MNQFCPTSERMRSGFFSCAHLMFQGLVNKGLFDKDKVFKSTKTPSPGRFVAVRANIDNKTYSEPKNQYEEDPELAELLHNMILEFRRPVLGRRGRQ